MFVCKQQWFTIVSAALRFLHYTQKCFHRFTSNLTRLLIAAYIKKPIMHKPSIAQPD